MRHRNRIIPSFAALMAVACVALSYGAAARESLPRLLRGRLGSIDPLRQSLADLPGVAPTAGKRPRIVQFWSHVTPGLRQALLARGMVLRGYVPDDALVVLATDSDVAWLRQLKNVRAVVDQPTAWRLDNKLMQATVAGLAVDTNAAPQTMLVEVGDAGKIAEVENVARDLGASVETSKDGARVFKVSLSAKAAARLATHPQVAAIDLARLAHTQNDTSYGMLQAGAVHRSPFWDKGLHGEGQIAAVCDVGANVQSCYFAGNKIVDYQKIGTAAPADISHGTHVAGSLAGDQQANGTYDLDDGMAPAARLVMQGAGTDVPGELSLPADFGMVLQPAFDQGARVHVDSWGIDSNSYSILERSLDAFVATHRDMLVVVAQGNSGSDAGSVGSPSTAKDVISAGAYDSALPDDVAPFSAHGPTSDGRIKPTLVAPGVNIVSADADQACGTAIKTGTSMAAPMIGGAAVLVRQYYQEGFYPSGSARSTDVLQPSAALVKATLIAGAQNLAGKNTGGAMPSAGQGFGKLKMTSSVSFAGDAQQSYVQDNNAGLQTGETFSTTLDVASAGPLRVVLVWMDEPGTPGAQKMLVNDLDLELTDANGQIYRGNGIANGASVADAAADSTNVEEVIALPKVAAGRYTVTVRGTNVPLGPQPFALVARGSLNAAATGKDAQLGGSPDTVPTPCSGTSCFLQPQGETPATSKTTTGGCRMGADDRGSFWLTALVAMFFARRLRARSSAT